MDRSAAARQSLSINRSLVILLPTEVKLSSRGTVSKSAADFAALHESACGRLCCKSPKLPGDKFPPEDETNRNRRLI